MPKLISKTMELQVFRSNVTYELKLQHATM